MFCSASYVCALFYAVYRFAAMLKSPLFLESALAQEVSVIQSESDKYKIDDHRKIQMIYAEIANKSHPFSRYSVGKSLHFLLLSQLDLCSCFCSSCIRWIITRKHFYNSRRSRHTIHNSKIPCNEHERRNAQVL